MNHLTKDHLQRIKSIMSSELTSLYDDKIDTKTTRKHFYGLADKAHSEETKYFYLTAKRLSNRLGALNRKISKLERTMQALNDELHQSPSSGNFVDYVISASFKIDNSEIDVEDGLDLFNLPNLTGSVESRVKQIIAMYLGVDTNNMNESNRIIEDLYADSLDVVEIVMAIEDEFGIEVNDTEVKEQVRTVQDAINFVHRYLNM
jgi:acyl carrier protein